MSKRGGGSNVPASSGSRSIRVDDDEAMGIGETSKGRPRKVCLGGAYARG